MLAVASPLPADPQAFAFEYKWDGMRAIVAVRKGRLSVLSRNQLEQAPRFPELAPIAAAIGRDVVLDGEIVSFDAKGRPDFGRMQNRFGLKREGDIREAAKAHPAHFLAFDLLELDGKDLMGLPYRERRKALESLKFQGASWATTPSHVGAGEAMLQMSRELGLEGVMAKRLDSRYVSGDRSTAWLKVRNRNRQEFVVGGWSEGEGSRRGSFGALLVGYHDRPSRKSARAGAKAQASRSKSAAAKGSAAKQPASKPPAARKLHYIGRVGSGYNAKDLALLQAELESLSTAKPPFETLPSEEQGKDVHFVKPRLVVEVEFNGLSRHAVLRQASFKGLRTDKSPDDVVWEQAEVNGTWQERSGADPSVSAS